MALDTRSDESLMQAFANADAEAFNILYYRHKGALYRYFLRQVSTETLAEDLYQECWSRVIKSAHSYQATAKWTTWAYRIAHNLVVDHFRTFKSNDSFDEQSEDQRDRRQNVDSPHDSHMNKQLAERLRHCITKLPAVQKEAFIFTQETDLTVQAIAEVMDASYEAVKTRIRYAKASLQDCLREIKESLNTENRGAS